MPIMAISAETSNYLLAIELNCSELSHVVVSSLKYSVPKSPKNNQTIFWL